MFPKRRRYDQMDLTGRHAGRQLDAIEQAADDLARILADAYTIAAQSGNTELYHLLAQSPPPLHSIMAAVAELRKIAK